MVWNERETSEMMDKCAVKPRYGVLALRCVAMMDRIIIVYSVWGFCVWVRREVGEAVGE